MNPPPFSRRSAALAALLAVALSSCAPAPALPGAVAFVREVQRLGSWEGNPRS